MEDVSIIGIELAKRDFQVDGPKALSANLGETRNE